MTTPQPGQLRIITKYHWSAFTMAIFKPRATINGHQLQLNWGENVLPAPLGQHHIEVHIPYLWNFGKASITVDNTTHVPVVHYSAPLLALLGGKIGTEPQKFAGMLFLSIVYGLLGLLFLFFCLGTALMGGN